MFNIKTLVAVASLAVTGSAFAKIDSPTASANGGEMSLTLWSASAEVSYIFDTGISLVDFRSQAAAPGFSYSVDLSADAEYQNFLTLVGSANDIQFAFFGGDNSGNAATARSIITTVSGDVTAITNGNVVNALNQFGVDNYLFPVNLDPRIQASANASATFRKGSGGNAYFGEVMGEDFNGQFQKVTANRGDSVAIYDITRSSTSSLADAVEAPLGNDPLMTAKYVGNTFTVTAVPEPQTYALMIAGLGIMGAVAARRRAK